MKYFELHPEKILAEVNTIQNKFGKFVTAYKGKPENISRIEVDTQFLGAEDMDNLHPLVSVIENHDTVVVDDGGMQAATQALLAAAASDRKAKRGKIPVAPAYEPNLEAPLYTFEEVYEKMNPNISIAELRAFIWTRQWFGRRLSQNWYDLANKGMDRYLADIGLSDEEVTQWVMNGIVFYSGGEYLYCAEFLSGNIYERQAQLQRDKEFITNTFGDDAFKMAEKRLNDVWTTVRNRRLTIDAIDENKRLKLQVNSDFCLEFMIQTLADEQPIVGKAAKEEKKNKPFDFKKLTEGSSRDRVAVNQISLKNAFHYWMIKHGHKVEVKRGINYQDVIDLYIESKNFRASSDANAGVALGDYSLYNAEKDQFKKKQGIAKEEGFRIFNEFLRTQLTLDDKDRIVNTWNATFNGIIKIDYDKIPVAFTVGQQFRGFEFFGEFVPQLDKDGDWIKFDKREAAAFTFNNGCGIVAYGVGYGKTLSSLFSIAQFMEAGYASRAMIVVPNQTYKQWISEAQALLPHKKIYGLYNLGDSYIQSVTDEDGNIKQLEEGSITILTEEGFMKLSLPDKFVQGDFITRMTAALAQEEKMAGKDMEKLLLKIQKMTGRVVGEDRVDISRLGIDMFVLDEAHSAKKVFTKIKGNAEGKGYQISSGVESNMALKTFMFSHYIQDISEGGNVVLLTATPFTNSPLEVYSMLAIVGFYKLEKMGLENLYQFFSNFIETNTELVINSKMQPQRKEVVTGFINLKGLQNIIFSLINFKDADIPDARGRQVKVNRPNKWVLPYRGLKLEKGTVIDEWEKDPTKKEKEGVVEIEGADIVIDSTIPMDAQTKYLMDEIIAYAEGRRKTLEDLVQSDEDVSVEDIASDGGDSESLSDMSDDDDSVFDESMDDEEQGPAGSNGGSGSNKSDKDAARALKAISYARNLAINPYLLLVRDSKFKAPKSVLGRPKSAKEYVEASPKFKYVMECIRSVKQWHESTNTPVSGQIIYCERGREYFPLLKRYLVEEIGYKEHEVGIIVSGLPKKGTTTKDYVKNLFNGEIYNEDTMEFEKVTDSQRIKVIIGSATIKEGMNLQKYSSVLYHCSLEWNPTDMVQLEGRLWRQGNKFKNVRIVIPIVQDSMDSFILQKVGEKMNRINQIWNWDGLTNVMDLREFDPMELKMAIIKDPVRLAQFEIDNIRTRLIDDLATVENEITKLGYAQKYWANVQQLTPKMIEFLQDYRPVSSSIPPIKLINIYRDLLRKQTDKEGRKMVYEWERDDMIKEFGEDNVSEHDPVESQYWFDTYNAAVKFIDDFTTGYLHPNRISMEDIGDKIIELESQKAAIEQAKKDAESDDKKQEIIAAIVEKIKSKQIRSASIKERVKEFNDLNFMLKFVDPLDAAPEATAMPTTETKAVETKQRRGKAAPVAKAVEKAPAMKKPDPITDNIKRFVPQMQLKTIKSHLKGEEGDFFVDMLTELDQRIAAMPKTYDTEGISRNDMIVHLHYFTSSSDWYIVEKDMEKNQQQAFGYVILNGDVEMGELGYVSIEELVQSPWVELDLYWKPKKLGVVLGEEEESTAAQSQAETSEEYPYRDAWNALEILLNDPDTSPEMERDIVAAMQALEVMLMHGEN